jgi:hypothetical protein
MYDWTDDLYIQATLSFPSLKGYIAACQEADAGDKLMELLHSLEFDGRQAA